MTESTEIPVTEKSELEPQTTTAAMSAGALLRQARERAGMHLGMLSVALKVPVRQLMALEADDHTPLSGPVFVRALANSVCRQLKIDAAPILALLPQASQRLHALPPSLESTREAWGFRYFGPRLVFGRKFLWLVLLMVLIALVAWLPEWPASAPQSDPVIPQAAVSDAAAPSTPMVVLLPSESSTDLAPGNAVASLKPAASTSVSTSGALEVVFKGKSDDAWVEVKDSNGALVFSQLVKAGETHTVKGMPALTVVVGLADAVEVLVRGQPLDLTPFSRGAVARFEVK
jgi:cytoskeleton protein RodZ